MRARPWEAPKLCPGPKRSSRTTPTPRRASAQAVAEPITPPPTTTTSVSRGVSCPPAVMTPLLSYCWWNGGARCALLSCGTVGSGGLRQARRVGLGLVDRLAGQPPALEHLLVAAVGDRAVERGGERRCETVAL